MPIFLLQLLLPRKTNTNIYSTPKRASRFKTPLPFVPTFLQRITFWTVALKWTETLRGYQPDYQNELRNEVLAKQSELFSESMIAEMLQPVEQELDAMLDELRPVLLGQPRQVKAA